MTLTLKKYVLHRERSYYEAAGWKYEGDLPAHHGEWSCLMTREMTVRDGHRITLATANALETGEIEIIAIVDEKEQIFAMSRTVAVGLSEFLIKALAER